MSAIYRQERDRIELALAMIHREARTNTIKRCTGLSDDRIRKLCSRYFGGKGGETVRRRRGKSPQQTARFVRNAAHQLQASTLLHLFIVHGLLTVHDGALQPRWRRPDIDVGERFCAAYDSYAAVHPQPIYSFEWGWALLMALADDDELTVSSCDRCASEFVRDRYGRGSRQ